MSFSRSPGSAAAFSLAHACCHQHRQRVAVFVTVTTLYALGFNLQYAVLSFTVKRLTSSSSSLSSSSSAAVSGSLSSSDGWQQDGFMYGALLSAYPFTKTFMSPLFGHWADRFGAKRMLVFSLFCSACCYACLFAVLALEPVLAPSVLLGLFWVLRLACGAFGASGAMLNIFVLQSGGSKRTSTRSSIPPPSRRPSIHSPAPPPMPTTDIGTVTVAAAAPIVTPNVVRVRSSSNGAQNAAPANGSTTRPSPRISSAKSMTTLLQYISWSWAVAHLLSIPVMNLLGEQATGAFAAASLLTFAAAAVASIGLDGARVTDSTSPPAANATRDAAVKPPMVDDNEVLSRWAAFTSAVQNAITSAAASPVFVGLMALQLVTPATELTPLLTTLFQKGPSSLATSYSLGALCSLLVPVSPMPTWLNSRFSVRQISGFGHIIVGVIIALLVFCSELWMLYAAVLVKGIVFVLFLPAHSVVLARLNDAGAVGASVGWQHAVKGASGVSGVMLFGWLVSYSIALPFVSAGVVFVATGLFLLCSTRARKATALPSASTASSDVGVSAPQAASHTKAE